jgi:hypothetical protein
VLKRSIVLPSLQMPRSGMFRITISLLRWFSSMARSSRSRESGVMNWKPSSPMTSCRV